ncbi:hypothetical protein BJV74DRAFT_245385 [Russula compacta]|nr:hypothetical protein BJV74DRAFT_245385 [Russula compacta]
MPSSLRTIMFPSFTFTFIRTRTCTLFFILILIVKPLPVSSLSIAMLTLAIEQNPHIPSPSSIDHKPIFDAIFSFSLFLALFCTYAWLRSRLTLLHFLLRVHRLSFEAITWAQQIFHACFTALWATLATIYDTDDANNARRAFPRPVAGLSHPISNAIRRDHGRGGSAVGMMNATHQ